MSVSKSSCLDNCTNLTFQDWLHELYVISLKYILAKSHIHLLLDFHGSFCTYTLNKSINLILLKTHVLTKTVKLCPRRLFRPCDVKLIRSTQRQERAIILSFLAQGAKPVVRNTVICIYFPPEDTA